MSTRAHIVIKDGEEDHDKIKLYRHCDGYPEGAGEDLKSVVQSSGWSDPEYLAADIIRMSPGKSFVPALSIHGDEEYFWTVDLEAKEIRYSRSPDGETTLFFEQA